MVSGLTRLGDDEVVFRLAPDRALDSYDPPPMPPVPSPDDFILTSKDKELSPKRLSVWDEKLTTPAEALAIRQASGRELPPQRAYFCDVRQIRKVAEELDVVRDPLPTEDPTSTMPGALGHCGVTGLDTGNSTSRKRLRWLLADVFVCRDHVPADGE